MGFIKKLGLNQLMALRESVSSLGGEIMNMLSPDNFEYYSCALELLDSNGSSVAYLSFDVMPNNIAIQKQPIISVVKTMTDVYTVTNDSFNPFNISLQGTFGRKLRILTSSKEINENGGFNKFLSGNVGAFFENDFLVKTGYGVIKMLQKMIEKSNSFSELGDGYDLIFHNFCFNEHYKVKVLSFDFNISTENNFIWYYGITMNAISKYDYSLNIKEKFNKTGKRLLGNIANNGIKNLLSDVDSHISQYFLTKK